jgi:hypothetical protein
MANKNTNNALSTLQGFKQAAAEIFAEFRQAIQLSRGAGSSYLLNDLDQARIRGAEVTVKDSKVVVTVTTDPSEYLGGQEAEDLKPEAIARREARQLSHVKRYVHAQLHTMTSRGEIKPEQAREALEALGYSAANMPSAETSISATYWKDGRLKSLAVAVPGVITKDEARARIETIADEDPVAALTLAAFPNAKGIKLEKVPEVMVSEKLTWPAYTAE